MDASDDDGDDGYDGYDDGGLRSHWMTLAHSYSDKMLPAVDNI